jgi:hypothetical protein
VQSLTGPNNCTLPSHLRLRSLFVASYDAQGLRWRYFLLHNIYKFSSYLTGNIIHLRSIARNSATTRPQRVSTFFYITYKFSSYFTGNIIHLRSIARNSVTARPQRGSTFFYITYINSVRTSQETIHLRSTAKNSDHWTTEAVYFDTLC